jgi:hypothetical protein
MSISDFLQLPPAVRVGFVVMLWPAIWAGVQLIVALAGDLLRQTKTHDTSGVASVPTVDSRS